MRGGRRTGRPHEARKYIVRLWSFTPLTKSANCTHKSKTRPPFLRLCLADGWDSIIPYPPDETLSSRIQKQRTRPPFFKLCVADGWAAGLAGGQRPTSQSKICYMFTISIEKQRKCPHLFFEITFGVRMGGLGEARIPMRVALLVFCWGRRGIFVLF